MGAEALVGGLGDLLRDGGEVVVDVGSPVRVLDVAELLAELLAALLVGELTFVELRDAFSDGG